MHFLHVVRQMLLCLQRGQRVPESNIVNNLFNVRVWLISELSIQLLTAIPWPQVHDGFISLPLMDLARITLINRCLLHGISDPLDLVASKSEALIGPQGHIPSERLAHGRVVVGLGTQAART